MFFSITYFSTQEKKIAGLLLHQGRVNAILGKEIFTIGKAKERLRVDVHDVQDEQITPPAPKRHNSLVEWIVALLVALALSLLLTQVIFVNAVVPSESMMDAIHAGDRLIGYRLAYRAETPQRGDIIIFRYPDDERQLYVKRVIALPGEEVEIREGQVYVNGQRLDESGYIKDDVPGGDYGPWQVPQASYFVMGDNRAHSWDSRYWNNTFVQEGQILGQVLFRIFPHPTKFT